MIVPAAATAAATTITILAISGSIATRVIRVRLFHFRHILNRNNVMINNRRWISTL